MLNIDLGWYQLEELKLKEDNACVEIGLSSPHPLIETFIQLGQPELYSTDHCRGKLLKNSM
jgi:hypothetical protein